MSSLPEVLDTPAEFFSLPLTERQSPLLEVPGIVADFFPAYDEDGGLLIALTPR